MNYTNLNTKLETLVTYFNENRINLNPVFQRGSVWTLKQRRELMKNVVSGRPMPAIFVYKDDDDSSMYTFSILDGKQRLESILLFIGHKRPDFRIANWGDYIFDKSLKKDVNFGVPFGSSNKLISLAQLDNQAVKALREYPIPTIEINLNENTSLDEIISLFVDINQYGVKVSRLQIVRALKRDDKFLRDVYDLIAVKQMRKQAVHAVRKKTNFTFVLKNLQVVAAIVGPNEQADRMWERLFELALFVRSGGKHRKPSEILKSFIKAPTVQQPKLRGEERKKLTKTFDFLASAYKTTELSRTRLATDQTHFYTMATSLLDSDLIAENSSQGLAEALVVFGNGIVGAPAIKGKTFAQLMDEYRDLSAKQTSDVSRRARRGDIFKEAIRMALESQVENKNNTTT
jgi:hypothetical protein